MKILLTLADLSITGGLERVCVNLANALCESGHNVEILSFYRANASLPYALAEGVKLHFYHQESERSIESRNCANPLSRLLYKGFYKFYLSLQVWWKFKGFDAYIVNCGYFTPFLKEKSTKYIRLVHLRFERFHTRNKFFDTLVILSSAQLEIWQKYHPHIRVIPNFFITPPPQHKKDAPTQKIVLSVGRMDDGDQKGFLRLVEIWALVCERLAQMSAKKASGEGTQEEQMQKAEMNGVEMKNTESREKIALDSQPCGTLESHNLESKSLDSVELACALREWKLVIVGEGEMKASIESAICAHGLMDSVILKPFTKDIESEYANASIYAMSSYYEGFAMVLLEASNHSLPCIAFDVPTGPSDLIIPGKSGYLISDGDLQGFADKLIELMLNEAQRRVFGKHGKSYVQRFRKENILPLWENLLA